MKNSDLWSKAYGNEEEFSSYICKFLQTSIGLNVKTKAERMQHNYSGDNLDEKALKKTKSYTQTNEFLEQICDAKQELQKIKFVAFESSEKLNKDEEKKIINNLENLLENTFELNNQMQTMKLHLSQDVSSKLKRLEKSIEKKIYSKKTIINGITINSHKQKYEFQLAIYFGIMAGAFISTYFLLLLGSILWSKAMGKFHLEGLAQRQ